MNYFRDLSLTCVFLFLFISPIISQNGNFYFVTACDKGDGTAEFNFDIIKINILQQNNASSGNIELYFDPGLSNLLPNQSMLVSQDSTIYAQIEADQFPGGSEAIPIDLFVLPLPVPEIIGDLQICVGESTTLEGTGGETYEWVISTLNDSMMIEGNTVTLNETNQGPLSLTVTDIDGCMATIRDTLEFSNLLETECFVSGLASSPTVPDGTVAVDIDNGRPTFTLYVVNEDNEEVITPVSGFEGGIFDVPDIPIGNHLLIIEDAFNCFDTCAFEMQVCDFSIDEDASFATDLNCFEDQSGAIDLVLNGGVGPYTFLSDQVDIDNTTNSANNLPAGTYEIVVEDGLRCKDTISFTINQPELLQLFCTSIDAINEGASNGMIQLDFEGGTPPYSVSWSGTMSGMESEIAADTFTIVGLLVGDYTIELTDANGCTETCTNTISGQPCTLDVDYAVTNINCASEAQGIIELMVVGGVPPYQYNWNIDSLNSEPIVDSLLAGIYQVTVTDAIECAVALEIEITEPEILSIINCSEVTPTTQIGGSDGTTTVTISGGVGPYSYTFDGASNGSQEGITDTEVLIENLPMGDYTLIVSDIFNCTAVCNFTILEPDCSNLGLALTATNVSCFGGTDGSITPTITNGTPPFTIEINSTEGYNDLIPSINLNTFDITDLPAGNYLIEITDTRLCSVTEAIEIFEPEPIELDCSNTTDVSVVGTNTGSAIITFTGGNPGLYAIRLDSLGTILMEGTTNDDSFQFTELYAGTYSVTVIDQLGCNQSCSIVINAPDCDDFSVQLEATNVSCNGENDGSINAVVIDGVLPLQDVSWSNGADELSLENLTPGDYTLTVTDARGCSDAMTETISEPAEIVLTCDTFGVSQVGGNDGMIQITFPGGNPGVDSIFLDSMGINLDQGTTGNNSFQFDGLFAGTYTVTVIDPLGCTQNCISVISEPACDDFSVQLEATNVSCNGENDGSINAVVIDGVLPLQDVSWSNGADELSLENLAPGDYTLTVTDARGCSDAMTETISEPAEIMLTCDAFGVSQTGGNDGMIQITFPGGNLGVDTVLLDSMAINLEQIISTDDAYQFTGLFAGEYQIIVIDAIGCTATCAVTVEEPNCDIELVYSLDTIACNGDLVELDLTVNNASQNNLSFEWSDGVMTEDRTDLVAGTYAVTVIDNNTLCEADTIIMISEPTELVIANCTSPAAGINFIELGFSGGTPNYEVVVTNGVNTILINDFEGGDTLLTNLPEGEYSVTMTDSNECSSICSFTISEDDDPPPPNNNCDDALLLTLNEPVLCPGDTIVVDTFMGVNTAGATASSISLSPDCAMMGNFSQLEWDVWYRIEALPAFIQELTIRVHSDFDQPHLVLFDGTDCDNLIELACSFDEDGDRLATISIPAPMEGNTYLLMLGGIDVGGFEVVLESEYEATFFELGFSPAEIISINLNPSENKVDLIAEDYSSIGSFGMWQSNSSSVVFSDANEAITEASNLQICNNTFTWLVSTFECPFYDEDQISIFNSGGIELEARDTFFEIEEGTSIENAFFIENDFLDTLSQVRIEIIMPPTSGSLMVFDSITSQFTYSPNEDFIGIDSFRYRICPVFDCPEVCDEGVVYVNVIDKIECESPFFSPNGDGKNDMLKFIKLLPPNNFENNRLEIFDITGKAVLVAQPYLNNWTGEFNGNDLEDGTYFFTLWLDYTQKEKFCKGFITLISNSK
ncbi:MAG: gliding motility-associated C-terminal domain-containing protein [Saprospiraceae bacterium]|nr:gliding motility-associated C-terminal domain-containing protein [Saprospiraceae bacterium]